ncbi:hypothetical protein C9374_010188 [Naegleria lovaniensis]|uniref:Uncharacterized protein n=1 Tax=Naegleria lovaniensis TaxID=51637 RepID=A0AA88KGB0_NAELO|nr:uncharacterized protein C9374_010188 [Naegleria lovaniensis]KAG2375184.1 hypothetical protein C9374_010188 [Naegleria lovaniensis]
MLTQSLSFSSDQFSLASTSVVTASTKSSPKMISNSGTSDTMASLQPPSHPQEPVCTSNSIADHHSMSTSSATSPNSEILYDPLSVYHPPQVPIHNKAPKGSLQSFHLLLGALDYINQEHGGQDYPRFSNTLWSSGGSEEEEEPLKHTVEQSSVSSSSHKLRTSLPTRSHTKRENHQEMMHQHEEEHFEENVKAPKSSSSTRKSSSKHSRSNSPTSTTMKNRGSSPPPQQHVNSEGLQICACCKRDSNSVSFLKNYSIHQGNIHNYRNCFPEYDVVPGISCMTCYHKQWRYTKGLYDPNKARSTGVNKREGIQRSTTSKANTPNSVNSTPTSQDPTQLTSINDDSTSSSSKRKKSSSSNSSSSSSSSSSTDQSKRKKADHEFEEEDNASTATTEGMKEETKKPRKLSKRRYTPAEPSSNINSEVLVTATPMSSFSNEMVDHSDTQEVASSFVHPSTSTSIEGPATELRSHQHHQHAMRLIVKFLCPTSNNTVEEVYNCTMYCDFVPTTLASIKSLVMGKLRTQTTGFTSCDTILWSSSEQSLNRVVLTDEEMMRKSLCNDDILYVYVR